jgi:hypothetical protein
MSNGNGVDLSAPLSRLWRDVYRKAAQVAEGRTAEQLKSHVYVYHPNGAGGGGTVEDLYVDEAGDTMTGTLYQVGPNILTNGGLVISGADRDAEAGQLFGPTSPPITGQNDESSTGTCGVIFTVSEATTILSVSWWHWGHTPERVQLWDVTAGTLRWEFPTFAVFDAGPGAAWNLCPIPAVDRPAPLEPSREYFLCWYWGAAHLQGKINGYGSPVPEGPITFVGHAVGGPASAPGPPFEAKTLYYLMDFTVGGDPVPSPPAASGAIRLPTGPDTQGRICWRDGANTADHSITFDEDGVFLIDGVPLGGGGVGGGNTVMHTQTATPTGAPNSLWFNPSESA